MTIIPADHSSACGGQESNNVIPLPTVRPKTVKSNYKSIPISYSFNPVTHKWKWEITITTVSKYSEVADSEKNALKAAQKYIDKHELGK